MQSRCIAVRSSDEKFNATAKFPYVCVKRTSSLRVLRHFFPRILRRILIVAIVNGTILHRRVAEHTLKIYFNQVFQPIFFSFSVFPFFF